MTSAASQSPTSFVALLSDFGDRDGYVGVVKGVILRLCPNCTIVDLAHHIDPQDVNHAGWVLNQCFDALPDQTVIIAVVDPYVGDATQRSVVLVFEAGQKVVVVPDNGLAGRLLARNEPVEVRVIENPALQGAGQSTTFHGRDRYAPVGAHLARAIAEGTLPAMLAAVGPSLPAADLKRQGHAMAPVLREDDRLIQGAIDALDRYGNLLTNVPNTMWPGTWTEADVATVQINDRTIPVVCCLSYSALQKPNEGPAPIGLIRGSHGCLELAVDGASLSETLGIRADELPTPFELRL